jgi:AraC-like DNA-binding protein
LPGPNQIVLSANLKNLYQMETAASKNDAFSSSFRILMKSEEDFLHELFHHTENNLRSESFSVNNLCKLIGMSQPQLYRKIVSLTGSSPNQFITDLRMQLAWELLKTKKSNVSQIAFELGYSNPSYFSKVFLQKFGHSPFTVLSSV